MAINQASFFLFAPRHGPSVTLDSKNGMAPDDAVRIISSKLVDDDAPRILCGAIRRWIETHGFGVSERYGGLTVYQRGERDTPFGREGEIVLSLPDDNDEEIEVVYIRFLLTEQTPVQWHGWRELIADFGSDFGFRLLGPDDEVMPCVDFFTALAENSNFQAFQRVHGWVID